MALHLLFSILLLSLPLFAGAGFIIYMMQGKGKPKPTQDEILRHKEGKAQTKSSV